MDETGDGRQAVSGIVIMHVCTASNDDTVARLFPFSYPSSPRPQVKHSSCESDESPPMLLLSRFRGNSRNEQPAATDSAVPSAFDER